MKQNIITVFKDTSVEMACVYLNETCLRAGNYWDFHDGCNGDSEKYGQYDTLNGFISNLRLLYAPVDVVYKEYDYETDTPESLIAKIGE